MKNLTLKIALEYQRKADPSKISVGQFKAYGRELCDLYGLTVKEALAILRGDAGWLDIVAAKEEAE